MMPSDFDKRFQKMNSDFDKRGRLVSGGMRVIFGLWVVWALICLGAVGTLVAVVYHFISKFW